MKADRSSNTAPKGRVFATSVQQSQKNNTVNTAVHQSKSSPSCIYCGEGTRHQLLECRKFAVLNGVEKSAICKKKGLCFGCMKQGHMKMNCPSPLKCSKCNRAHPTPLHDPNREKKEPGDKPSETPSVRKGVDH